MKYFQEKIIYILNEYKKFIDVLRSYFSLKYSEIWTVVGVDKRIPLSSQKNDERRKCPSLPPSRYNYATEYIDIILTLTESRRYTKRW